MLDHKYLAVNVGNEFLFGRFNFYQQLGIYLYAPYERVDAVYQRYGLSYRVIDNLIFGINIKAHRHIADFMDFRLGYMFDW